MVVTRFGAKAFLQHRLLMSLPAADWSRRVSGRPDGAHLGHCASERFGRYRLGAFRRRDAGVCIG